MKRFEYLKSTWFTIVILQSQSVYLHESLINIQYSPATKYYFSVNTKCTYEYHAGNTLRSKVFTQLSNKFNFCNDPFTIRNQQFIVDVYFGGCASNINQALF